MKYEAMTDKELTRAVAEALGWQARALTAEEASESGDSFARSGVVAPNGEIVLVSYAEFVGAVQQAEFDAMWNMLVNYAHEHAAKLPAYSVDLNAVVALIPLIDRQFVLWYETRSGLWCAEIERIGAGPPIQGRDEEPTRAICIAWLRWHDEQEAR